MMSFSLAAVIGSHHVAGDLFEVWLLLQEISDRASLAGIEKIARNRSQQQAMTVCRQRRYFQRVKDVESIAVSANCNKNVM
jgi:hypothetical protein